MSETVVSVEHLKHRYGEYEAVKDVGFTIDKGKVLGFLGPNGAGKSTTIKVLTGQMPAQDGTLRILGHDVHQGHGPIAGRIGVSFEEKNLYTDMTAAENLRFFASLYGRDSFDPLPLLRRVGLESRAHDRVDGYSKGMRQRLMVARAILNEPEVLFLDEPTAGLDPVSARSLRELIREEAHRGAAVLLTTHDMHEADELSHQVAFLNEGRILALDTPEKLKIAHGKRAVRIRHEGADGEPVERSFSLDEAGVAEKIAAAIAEPGLLSVHTEEASLEDIFVQLAGRALAG